MNRSVSGLAVLLCLSAISCLQRLDSLSIDPAALIQGFLNTSSGSGSGLNCSGLCVGGQIYGGNPAGLVLDFNGTACGGPLTLNPTATGSYAFGPITDGCSAANVTITSQATNNACQIYNNTGIAVTGANVSNVDIYCFSIQLPTGPLTVYEATPLQVDVSLTASPGPTGVVTVNVGSSNAAITTTSGFNFTSANFSIPQTVTFTNLLDNGSTASESSTMTSYIGAQALTTVTVNSVDTTPGSNNRYIYVTNNTHAGDFAGDAGLAGANWMEKADSFCSRPSNLRVSPYVPLAGTGNYRAVLVDGVLRNALPGAQIAWPIRGGVTYEDSNTSGALVTIAIASGQNVFPVPIDNAMPSGGSYFTGMADTPQLWTAAAQNCTNWSVTTGNGATGNSGGTGTTFVFSSSVPCTTGQARRLLCVQDLRDRGDGTISSAYQNLLWQKCEAGQTWAGSCTGTATTYAYCTTNDSACETAGVLASGPAYDYCNSLNTALIAGRTDWRVPSLAEIQELYIEVRPGNSLFPGLVSGNYLSATSASTTNASLVDFSTGSSGPATKSTSQNLRCVSPGGH